MSDLAPVTKEWEAFGSKETVFGQHLEAMDKAQENLARMIALKGQGLKKEELETQIQFITYFIKSILKARIKVTKYNTESDNIFRVQLDKMMGHILAGDFPNIKFSAFVNTLYKIGILYDKLGYNSPERLKTKTPMQSDLELPGMESDEYVESLKSGYLDE